MLYQKDKNKQTRKPFIPSAPSHGIASHCMMWGTILTADALKTKSERRRTQRALLKSAKQKMGLLESFRFLSQSKYLGYVGLVVVSYGLSMEFTEIVWKVNETGA